MKTFLAAIGLLGLVWVLSRWLALTWFRSKVLAVLEQELSYKPSVPGLQSATFNAITKQGRGAGWNEYDAAIAFMLVQLGVLPKPLSADASVFYMEKMVLVSALAQKATVGNQLIVQFRNGRHAA